MSVARCPRCGAPCGDAGLRCEDCGARLPNATGPRTKEPAQSSEEEEETTSDRPGRRAFPSRRVAWVGFGSVILGVVLLGTSMVLTQKKMAKEVAPTLGVSGICLFGFVGLPCLFVPLIARVASALDRRQRLKLLVYRGGMAVIGLALGALCLYRIKEGAIGGGLGAGTLATLCLWYGAVRGENPDVE
jgi:hypothetical protein